MLNQTRLSLPSLNSTCYQHGYPEECVTKLAPLYKFLHEHSLDPQPTITLVGNLLYLILAWRMEVPFSLLARLFRVANRFCGQNLLNQCINEQSFHQLMHNPELQHMYRKKPTSVLVPLGGNEVPHPYSTPQTLCGLFNRLYEMIQRKLLYTKVSDDKTSIQDRFNTMVQLVGQQEPKSMDYFPTIVRSNDNILIEADVSIENVVKEAQKEGIQQAKEEIKQRKFIPLEKVTPQLNSRMRRVHSNMLKQMSILQFDSNVKKVNKLIEKATGSMHLRLPEL